MKKNYMQIRYSSAEKVIDEVIKDDDKWNLFMEQIKSRDLPDINGFRYQESYKSFLVLTYVLCSGNICDSCDYNPNQRGGKRRFSKKKRFDCNWRKTKGDELARETAKEIGLKGFHAYNINEPAWNKKFKELSKIVLEEHKDRTKTPPWLDTERNTCQHYYIDLTKP